jgi:uncharacterized protein (TIGR02246 family)
MRKVSLVLSSVVLAGSTLAAEPKPPAASGADPMAAWRPPRVANEAKDRQEILALFQKMEQAGKRADLDAAAALVDFPVLMVTDDSKGEAHSAQWTREQWVQAMRPFYEKPMDMNVQHQPTISVLTDSLATVVDRATFTMGGKTVTTRSSTLLVRKGGGWKIKALVEGGWGDAMNAMQTAGTPSSSSGAGAAEDEGTFTPSGP